MNSERTRRGPGVYVGACLLSALLTSSILLAQEEPDALETPPGETPPGETDPLAVTRAERIKEHQERIREQLEMIRAYKAQSDSAVTGIPIVMPPPGITPSIRPPAPQPTVAPPQAAPPPVDLMEARTFLSVSPGVVSAMVGERFDTEVVVQNERYVPLDEIELRLAYPRYAVALEEVSDAALRPIMLSEPTYESDPLAGRVYYHAWLSSPDHFRDRAVLRLRWRALAPSSQASIEFIFAEDEETRTTALRFADHDRLGDDDVAADGVLSAQIFVEVPDQRSDRPILARATSGEPGGMKLRLTSTACEPKAGEEFEVAVRLENPRSQFLDTARVRLWFDANVLRVVDWDRGNWMKRGVNVHDAFAREDFPFSFHRVNSADNERGTIDYEMGMADRFVPREGELFKVRFEALEADPTNAVWFDVMPSNPRVTDKAPATAMLSEGRNMVDYAALIGSESLYLRMPIAPAPEPEPTPTVEVGDDRP